MIIDLQLHSIHSDGYLTPTQLASFVAKQGVKIASLTDHNTLSGQKEFREACAKHKIKTIPGLELYVRLGNRKFNIIWYNYDEKSPELQAILLESQKRRRRNMR
ncbi:MAG: PHP domain-containing protein, partial [Candidatus Falkowbacteria bacterium]